MIAALLLASAAVACPIERAHYSLRTDPRVTVTVRKVATDDEWREGIALRMHIASSGRTYWWLPWNGGTNGRQNLASTTDPTAPDWKPGGPRPLGDVDFISTDRHYRIADRVPRRGDPAPAHFFISDLGEALWYRTPNDARDGTARQFFDLVGCGR